jgi:hypothetical protein
VVVVSIRKTIGRLRKTRIIAVLSAPQRICDSEDPKPRWIYAQLLVRNQKEFV